MKHTIFIAGLALVSCATNPSKPSPDQNVQPTSDKSKVILVVPQELLEPPKGLKKL